MSLSGFLRNESSYQSLQRLCVICYLNSIRILRLWLEFCHKWVRLSVSESDHQVTLFQRLRRLLRIVKMVRVNNPKLYFTNPQRSVKKRFKFKPSSKCTKEFHWGLDSLTTNEIWKTFLSVLGHTTIFLRMPIVLSYYRFSDRCMWMIIIHQKHQQSATILNTHISLVVHFLPSASFS